LVSSPIVYQTIPGAVTFNFHGVWDKFIPADQGRQLIDKLNMLSSIYFKKKMRHVWNISSLPHTNNKEFFYTVDMLTPFASIANYYKSYSNIIHYC
jgi:hypothetical protein